MAVADPWQQAKDVIGGRRLVLGPQAADQYLNAPDHLAMVLSRYRAAAALIGGADRVLEAGAGECIGTGIIAKGRRQYVGIDTDADALSVASELLQGHANVTLHVADASDAVWMQQFDAVVSLDVAEHIDPSTETEFFENLCRALRPYGRLVIGTPSAHMHHLASPQSRAGHINLFTPERLQQRLARHFHATQMLFMQDVAIHLGHPSAAHYIMGVGIGPR